MARTLLQQWRDEERREMAKPAHRGLRGAPRPRKLLVNYDNCCPRCKHSFRIDDITECFTGADFLSEQKGRRINVVCPECDSMLRVSVVVDFAISELDFGDDAPVPPNHLHDKRIK